MGFNSTNYFPAWTDKIILAFVDQRLKTTRRSHQLPLLMTVCDFLDNDTYVLWKLRYKSQISVCEALPLIFTKIMAVETFIFMIGEAFMYSFIKEKDVEVTSCVGNV